MGPDLFDTEASIANIDNPIATDEGLGQAQDPLSLSIPDDELCKVVDKKIEDSKKFWESKYQLKDRRKKMESALFGRDIKDKEKNNELKRYEARYSSNKLYEIEATLKPVAMSHLPDMIVSPGNESTEAVQAAKDISTAVNDDLKKRQNRQVLGLAFKHLPVYLTAVIKVRWNPEIDDYEFINVHPERVILPSNAKSAKADEMEMIPELVTMTVQDIVMRWPKKRQVLFDKLKSQGLAVGDSDFNWRDLATEVAIWEVWFTWYKKADEDENVELSGEQKQAGVILEEPGNNWERIEGVLWKYEDIVFAKIKNPNFDYEGNDQWFTFDNPADENSKRPVDYTDAVMSYLTGQLPANTQKETVYFNYFTYPKKPYFFFGYDQWGKVAIDETSRIEQNLYNQENLNTQGKQIIDTLKARVKHIWSTDSGLTAEDVQQLDMENPKMDALVDDDVNKVHGTVTPERPDAAQFNALKQTSDDMFALAGATSLTGMMQSDVATTNQIAREQNFTRADDLVEDTINAAAEWMASWALQMVKLRYTEEHMRKLLGNTGGFTFLKLRRDQIDNGMEVMIKASGTDKVKAQNNAMEMAKLGPPYVNPLDFFKDMDISDPEGRAERGMVLATNPPMYLSQFVLGNGDVAQQANALNGMQATPAPGGNPTAPQNPVAPAGANPQTGAPAPAPTLNPSPQNTSAIPQLPPAPPGSVRGI